METVATKAVDKISETVEQIEAVAEKANEIWESRPKNFGVKKQSRIELRCIQQIHNLHSIQDQLFHLLWGLLEASDFESVEMEEIDREKRFNGRKDVTRITWCDGVFHYVTNKKEEFLYGYGCTC
jgi:hypothetical protein